MALCALCQKLSPWTIPRIKEPFSHDELKEYVTHHLTFTALRQSSLTCPLCSLIHTTIVDRGEHRINPGILQEDLPIQLGSYRHSLIAPGGPSQLYSIAVRCGECYASLVALAKDGSEAAVSREVAGRFPLNPDSDEGFAMVSTWFKECIEKHPHTCRLPGNLTGTEVAEFPTRLLDVGAAGDLQIRLIDSRGMTGQYAALSHRWPLNPMEHFKTTTLLLDQRKAGITIDAMPLNFQDAVKVTRKLGIQYLWIDSLCIIQDNTDDWECESAVMGQVYNHSTVTIRAAPARTGTPPKQYTRGFLSRSTGITDSPTVEIPYRKRNGELAGSWFMQPDKYFHIGKWDLHTRGWVLQEEQLARRSITYYGDKVSWLCKLSTSMTSEPQRGEVYSPEYVKNAGSMEIEDFNGYWLDIAFMYSMRHLTFETDRFPALSGLATYFSKRLGKQYYAGIFSGGIAHGLLWCAVTPGILSRRDVTGYVGPSWSWMSVNGRITFKGRGGDDESVSALGDVTFKLTPHGRDPNGTLKDGQMQLTGNIKSVTMRRIRAKEDMTMRLEADSKVMANFQLDFADQAPSENEIQEVECLLVMDGDDCPYNVLVLRRAKQTLHFERIGIANVDPAWFGAGSSRHEYITVV
ncbi:hypothetical protein V493_02745 [Pseudogymnoascus sp. VKM F-4281 (FW-2241)]|nr:hypothetical protein V493_02745 [Pseudogymnoascus sp. VKM F-4281 (FW-2241)]